MDVGINHPEGPVTVRIGSGNTRQESSIARNDIKPPVLSEIMKERSANVEAREREQRACQAKAGAIPNGSIRSPSGIGVYDPLFSDV